MSQMALALAVPWLWSWPKVCSLVNDRPRWVCPGYHRLFSSELIPVLFCQSEIASVILALSSNDLGGSLYMLLYAILSGKKPQ